MSENCEILVISSVDGISRCQTLVPPMLYWIVDFFWSEDRLVSNLDVSILIDLYIVVSQEPLITYILHMQNKTAGDTLYHVALERKLSSSNKWRKDFFWEEVKQKLWKYQSIARKPDSQLVTMNIFRFCVASVLFCSTQMHDSLSIKFKNCSDGMIIFIFHFTSNP